MTKAKLGFGVVLLLGSGWFLFSRLVFTPLPWADGSAFFLAGLDLVSWPPRWLMHNQAAFVPSYDQANFNAMPLLPLILGVTARLGLTHVFESELLIRIVSWTALVAWAWILWNWLCEAYSKVAFRNRALVFSTVVVLAGFLDPILRWGTLVVRTETWIGLCWLLIYRELFKISQTKPLFAKMETRYLRRISAYLAVAAYFHFEAIVLVPATVVGLWAGVSQKEPLRNYRKRLVTVGLKTLLFLSPWILYVIAHRDLFITQMDVQFHRLHIHALWLENFYVLFHYFFPDLGAPVGWPKFFNIGKAIVWALILALTADSLWSLAKTDNGTKKSEPILLASGAITFWVCFYLWCSKPEMWFVTLCHLSLWPWLGVSIWRHLENRPGTRDMRIVRFFLGASTIFMVLALFADLGQQLKTGKFYSWKTYNAWVDCVERTLPSSSNGQPVTIWEPHVPDFLVELAARSHGKYDLTRALDFPNKANAAWKFTYRVDVLALTRLYHFPSNQIFEDYEGPERPSDVKEALNPLEVPFGSWVEERFPHEHPEIWAKKICQVGPFWADLAIRQSPTR